MAAAITLSSSTLEGQLMELVTAIQIKENDETTNANGANLVTANMNLDTKKFSGSFNLDITTAVGSNGAPTVEAVAYLT